MYQLNKNNTIGTIESFIQDNLTTYNTNGYNIDIVGRINLEFKYLKTHPGYNCISYKVENNRFILVPNLKKFSLLMNYINKEMVIELYYNKNFLKEYIFDINNKHQRCNISNFDNKYILENNIYIIRSKQDKLYKILNDVEKDILEILNNEIQ